MSFEERLADTSLAEPLPASPLALIARWLDEARQRSGQSNPDAMTLASVDASGEPNARVVLCRRFDAERGELVFYTNRNSRKGVELAERPVASAVFHWDAMSRQVRVQGPVAFSAEADSDAYFAGRARASQIAAWASDQSAPLASRRALLERLASETERLGGLDGDAPIPRPPHWGGYRLRARRVELWVGSRERAHDRACWVRELASVGDERAGPWRVTRLQP